jgi:Uma2 family endonuclease
MVTRTTSAPTRITEGDLLRLGADVWAEVVNGELILTWPERGVRGGESTMGPVGFLHGIIAGNVYDALKPFVVAHKLGYVLADGVIYILSAEEESIRSALVPDVSFVRKGRLPSGYDLARPFPGAPDLAVEVISPGDAAADVLAKVDAYLNAGTAQVWALYPTRRELHQYRRAEGRLVVQVTSAQDRIAAEELFPGLELVVETLFRLPEVEE